MRDLASTSDLRAAGDQAKALMAQWKQTGPCEKADADRLWQSFKSAQDNLYRAINAQREQRKQEARQRQQEFVFRLEQQLQNVDAAIYRAREAYSRALSAPRHRGRIHTATKSQTGNSPDSQQPGTNLPHWKAVSQSSSPSS